MRWNPSVHAVRRLKERCGIEETEAKSYFNQLMRTAKYVTTQAADRLIYKAEGIDLLIAVNPERNTIITVHSATETEDGAPSDIAKPTETPKPALSLTVDRIANAVKREFKRMQTEVTREVRKLSEQVAIMHAEAAQLNVNKIRCRAPHTQLLIQTRIDDILTRADELAKVIDAKLTEIERAKNEVQAVAGE